LDFYLIFELFWINKGIFLMLEGTFLESQLTTLHYII